MKIINIKEKTLPTPLLLNGELMTAYVSADELLTGSVVIPWVQLGDVIEDTTNSISCDIYNSTPVIMTSAVKTWNWDSSSWDVLSPSIKDGRMIIDQVTGDIYALNGLTELWRCSSGTWSKLTDIGIPSGFSTVEGLSFSVKNGVVYLAGYGYTPDDPVACFVLKYDSSLTKLGSTFGGNGRPNAWGWPQSAYVYVDESDTVYVANRSASGSDYQDQWIKIFKYTTDWTLIVDEEYRRIAPSYFSFCVIDSVIWISGLYAGPNWDGSPATLTLRKYVGGVGTTVDSLDSWVIGDQAHFPTIVSVHGTDFYVQGSQETPQRLVKFDTLTEGFSYVGDPISIDLSTKNITVDSSGNLFALTHSSPITGWYLGTPPPPPPPPSNYIYWIKNTTDTWNNSNNWALSSGGPGGAGVPSINEVAIFDQSGTGSCSIDTSVSIGGLIVENQYPGTISQDGHDIFIGNYGATFNGGSFLGGSKDITSNGTVYIGLSTFTSNSGNFLIRGNFYYTGVMKNPSYVSVGSFIFVKEETFILQAEDLLKGYVILDDLPSESENVTLTIVGGPAQEYGTDFTINIDRLYWSEYLSEVMIVGEKLVVMYPVATEIPPGYGAFVPNNCHVIIDSSSDSTIYGGGVSFHDLEIRRGIKTYIDSNVNVEGSLIVDSSVMLPCLNSDGTRGNIKCYRDATFSYSGELGPDNDTDIAFVGGGLQRLILEGSPVIPSIIVDKTNSSQVIVYGDDIVVNKNFYINDGTFNTNGRNLFVGLIS